jgi:hypothetical protein
MLPASKKEQHKDRTKTERHNRKTTYIEGQQGRTKTKWASKKHSTYKTIQNHLEKSKC